MQLATKSLIFILAATVWATQEQLPRDELRAYLDLPTPQEDHLDTFLASGRMDGFFDTNQIFDIFNFLTQAYPDHITRQAIGKTTAGADMWAYTISTNLKSVSRKSEVLFTALHHAREVLSGNMMIKIVLELLHKCRHGGPHSDFLRFSNVLMVPIVNVDGHRFISDAYGGPNWEENKLKRKNTNRLYCG